MLQAPQPSSISVREQIATDFKRTEQCLIRLDACQRKIDTCQTTIEQYRASGMDIQDELADLTKLQHEKAILTDSLPDLVRKFKIALHDNV